MKRGIKTFARALRDDKIEKAKEMLDKIVQGNTENSVWEGYRRALEGMVTALESERELTLPRQIADGEIPKKELEGLKDEMAERASQEFRPPEERGSNAAWADVLQVILE